MAARIDGRAPEELRPLHFQRDFLHHAPGSVLVSMGRTRVLCSCFVNDGVPPFLTGKRTGWLTAEYNMLPASTQTRKPRERGGKVDGRSTEIQRLIGRSLRSVVDLDAIPDRTIWIDCEVLDADGGTRTAALNGAWVALYDAMWKLEEQRLVKRFPITRRLAAVSVGLIEGEPLLDLCYAEDFRAEVDLNVVMTGTDEFLEVQGGAEKAPFSSAAMDRLLALGRGGVEEILTAQAEALDLPENAGAPERAGD